MNDIPRRRTSEKSQIQPPLNPIRKIVHFVLGTKGGIGKTYVAKSLAELHKECNIPITVVDADPLSPTLSKYTGLNPIRLELMEDDDRDTIDKRKFDNLFEMIVKEDTHFVIDAGSASFQPLISYMKEMRTVREIRREAGKDVVINTLVTGGPEMDSTLEGFADLMKNFRRQTTANGDQIQPMRPVDEPKVLLWLNAYKAEVKINGVELYDTTLYQENKATLSGVIVLKKWDIRTFGKDVDDMLGKHRLLKEVLEAPDIKSAAKSRIKRVRAELYIQFKHIPLFMPILPSDFMKEEEEEESINYDTTL